MLCDLRLLRVDTDDWHDGEGELWVFWRVFVRVPNFSGQYEMFTLLEELEELYGWLAGMCDTLAGEFHWRLLEIQLEWDVTMGKGGRAQCRLLTRRQPGEDVLLECHFETDQAYLTRTRDELGAVIQHIRSKIGEPSA